MSLKLFAFLVFACLQANSLNAASVRSGNDCDAYKSKCPAVDGPDSVYIPLPDCTKFCQCSNGTPYLFDCPANLHFNPKLNVCDWPDAAGCTGGSGGSGENGSNGSSDESGNGDSAGSSSSESDESGNSGSVESSSSQKPSTQAPTTKAPTKAPTTAKPSRTCDLPANSCPAVDGTWPVYIPLPNCSQFCECSNGVPYLFDCPDNLHFNPSLNVCDWPNVAGCNGGSGGSGENGSNGSSDESGNGDSAGSSSSESDESGNSGSVESSSSQKPSEAPTTKAPTKAPTTAKPSRTCDLPANSCPAVDGTWPVYIPLPNCSQFCECSNGVPYLFDCPDNLHFNPSLNVCDWPNVAGCNGGSGGSGENGSNGSSDESGNGDSAGSSSSESDESGNSGSVESSSSQKPSTQAPTTKAPTKAPTTAKPSRTCDLPANSCPAVDGTWPVYIPLPNCSQFCECSNGVPYLFDCPDNLHFNPSLNVCDWPNVAGCNGGSGGSGGSGENGSSGSNGSSDESGNGDSEGSSSSESQQSGGNSGEGDNGSKRVCDVPPNSCPAVDGAMPVYLALPNCGQFCECSNGTPYLFDCPDNLHFNPTLNVCDWPDVAGCKSA